MSIRGFVKKLAVGCAAGAMLLTSNLFAGDITITGDGNVALEHVANTSTAITAGNLADAGNIITAGANVNNAVVPEGSAVAVAVRFTGAKIQTAFNATTLNLTAPANATLSLRQGGAIGGTTAVFRVAADGANIPADQKAIFNGVKLTRDGTIAEDEEIGIEIWYRQTTFDKGAEVDFDFSTGRFNIGGVNADATEETDGALNLITFKPASSGPAALNDFSQNHGADGTMTAPKAILRDQSNAKRFAAAGANVTGGTVATIATFNATAANISNTLAGVKNATDANTDYVLLAADEVKIKLTGTFTAATGIEITDTAGGAANVTFTLNAEKTEATATIPGIVWTNANMNKSNIRMTVDDTTDIPLTDVRLSAWVEPTAGQQVNYVTDLLIARISGIDMANRWFAGYIHNPAIAATSHMDGGFNISNRSNGTVTISAQIANQMGADNDLAEPVELGTIAANQAGHWSYTQVLAAFNMSAVDFRGVCYLISSDDEVDIVRYTRTAESRIVATPITGPSLPGTGTAGDF